MKNTFVALLASLASAFIAVVGCGGGGGGGTAPGATPVAGPPREPVTAAELRTRWEKLANDETDVIRSIDDMAGAAPEAKMQKLGRAREGAGFVMSALVNSPPPEELKICHAMASEGAKELKGALDGINDLWTGRLKGERRAESERLAEALCIGAGKLAAARSACGVTARVPSPVLCAGR